ncbi:MAG TPA: type II toxin-antitoxin system HicA family toxin [Myxococcota bacterium]|jgi:predicted RNA binding protein YcfA (HicA-like mRNA interferase family)|nr:type II toxin-antitoxin system HicA family toxin [Myxococcota bacterium]
MVALPILSGAECIKGLARLGYVVVRQRGSHVRLRCPNRSPLTVPLHGVLDRGTLRAILRAAGLTVEEFLTLLA